MQIRDLLELDEKLAQAQRHKEKLRFALTSSSLVLTLGGALLALFSIRNDQSRRNAQSWMMDSAVSTASQEREISELTRRLALSEQADARIQHQLIEAMAHPDAAGKKVELSSEDRQALSDVEKTNLGLNQRLTALETALLQTPEKAVALPLLRQQLSDIQDKAKGDSDSLHIEINHLYGMLQWFLGLMITLIIGVGGLAANSFRQSGARNRPQLPEKDEGSRS